LITLIYCKYLLATEGKERKCDRDEFGPQPPPSVALNSTVQLTKLAAA